MIYIVSGQERLYEKDIKKASIQDVLEYFTGKDIIEIDTETEYNKRIKEHLPNPYESKVLSLQLGDKYNQFVIDLNTIDISRLKILFEDENKLKIFCNAFFDIRFILHWNFNIKNIYDIFLAECIIFKGLDLPKGFRGLEQMSGRYLGVKVSKEVRGQIHWRGLDDKVIRYAAGDVTYLNEIRLKQIEILKERNELRYLDFENKYCVSLTKMSYKGFKVDSIKWLEVKRDNEKKIYSLLHQLDCEINKLFPSNSLFPELSGINWNSYKQVLPLFKKLGIDTKKRDRNKGEEVDSVDIKNLKKQSNKFPILKIYIEYKEIQKELTTYGENFIKDNINPVTKKIHSEYFQILDTSRISSNNPNLQNIPGTDSEGNVHPLRKCFIPSDNNILIISDFSQQEPRLMAEYTQDPILVDFVLNGDGDFHSFAATLMSPKLLGKEIKVSKKNDPLVPKYGKKIRYMCKQLNLKLDYGGTAFTLKDDLECTQEEAQELIDYLQSRTPKKLEYFKKLQAFVEQKGYIHSVKRLNVITYFYGFKEYTELKSIPYEEKSREQIKRFYRLKGEMERFAMNNPIQNSGAIMTKLAHIYFDRKLEENNLQNIAWVVNCVHDEIIVDCNKEYSEIVSKLLKQCMIDAGAQLCKIIPMKADPIIADCWEKD